MDNEERFPPLERTINFANTPCNCPPGQCAKFVDDDAWCVNRIDGEVVTRSCPVCAPDGKSYQWHHNGQCLRCKHDRETVK